VQYGYRLWYECNLMSVLASVRPDSPVVLYELLSDLTHLLCFTNSLLRITRATLKLKLWHKPVNADEQRTNSFHGLQVITRKNRLRFTVVCLSGSHRCLMGNDWNSWQELLKSSIYKLDIEFDRLSKQLLITLINKNFFFKYLSIQWLILVNPGVLVPKMQTVCLYHPQFLRYHSLKF